MRAFIISFTLVMFCIGQSWNVTAQTGANDGPLTNAAVVKLVKADFKEKTIVAIIGSRPSRFDLSTERMIELKRNGVSEKIILAMLAHQQGFAFDESWNDDTFFSQGKATVPHLVTQSPRAALRSASFVRQLRRALPQNSRRSPHLPTIQ